MARTQFELSMDEDVQNNLEVETNLQLLNAGGAWIRSRISV